MAIFIKFGEYFNLSFADNISTQYLSRNNRFMLAFWASHVTSACHFSTCCNHKYRKLQIRSWEKRKKKNDEAETSDNDFRKVAQRKAEANSRNISVGWQCRRYRAQKRTTGRVRSVHFIGRIFMERRHELAANSMNVWWSESDRSEVAESPLSFSLSLSPSNISHDNVTRRSNERFTPGREASTREKDRTSKWLAGKIWHRNDRQNHDFYSAGVSNVGKIRFRPRLSFSPQFLSSLFLCNLERDVRSTKIHSFVFQGSFRSPLLLRIYIYIFVICYASSKKSTSQEIYA